jgi:hypothetical protein
MLRPEVSQAAGTTEKLLLESLQVCSPKDALTGLQEGNARFAKAWTTASTMGTPEQRLVRHRQRGGDLVVMAAINRPIGIIEGPCQ